MEGCEQTQQGIGSSIEHDGPESSSVDVGSNRRTERTARYQTDKRQSEHERRDSRRGDNRDQRSIGRDSTNLDQPKRDDNIVELAELHRITFEAVPFDPSPYRANIISDIVRKTASIETLFTDYQPACKPLCEDVTQCERCADRLRAVAWSLSSPTARVWEVWKHGEESEVVGILYLTKIIPGCDALAHYAFFDLDLQGKTKLIQEMIDWCFTEHEDWYALRRLTIEVPNFAFALARHATLKLGFGGSYHYEHKRQRANGARQTVKVPVEGVRRSAIRWKGADADLLVLGRLNG